MNVIGNHFQKYYNVLLGEWAAKYEKSPRKGMAMTLYITVYTMYINLRLYGEGWGGRKMRVHCTAVSLHSVLW